MPARHRGPARAKGDEMNSSPSEGTVPDGPMNEHKVLESGAAQGTEPRNAAR